MPPKSLKNAAAHAKELGIVQPIGSFFKVQKKAGRPKKASTLTSIFDAADMRDKTAGAPPAAAAPAAAAPAAAAPVAAAPAAAAPAAAPAAKKSRRNYSEGENKRKLDEAIAEFKTGPIDPFTDDDDDNGNVAAPLMGRGFRVRTKRARSDEDSD